MDIDYVIAIGIFVITFVTVGLTLVSWVGTSAGATQTQFKQAVAALLLDWTFENLSGNVYRIEVVASGSSTKELAIVNLSSVGIAYDRNSITVTDGNASLPYQRDGDVVRFAYDVEGNKTIYVWFDDDSAFSDRSSEITAEDVIQEQLWPVETVKVVEWRAIVALNNSNYTALHERFGVNFKIILSDVLNFGKQPGQHAIIKQRNVLWQDADGDVQPGLLSVGVW